MSPKGEGFKLMGFWGAGGPFLVLKTSEMHLRCQNLSRFWDYCFIWFICEPIYVALFSLNIYRPFEGLLQGLLKSMDLQITSRFFGPKTAVDSNISEARWHRWIGLPKSDTFVRWGTEQALGSNEWESTHARFIMTSRFCGPKSIVKCSRFGKSLAKKDVSNAGVKRFQQIPQTIFSPVFFLIPRILGVKVFIASKWLRLPVDSADHVLEVVCWRSFKRCVSTP